MVAVTGALRRPLMARLAWCSKHRLLRHLVSVDWTSNPAPEVKTQEHWASLQAEESLSGWLKLFHIPVLKLRIEWSLADVYLSRSNDHVFDFIDAAVAEGLVPPLTADSRVLEPGCNVGGILREVRRRYDAEVTGIDLSTEAIRYARERVFADDARVTLLSGDVTDPATLAPFADGQFSHVLVISHLVHIPEAARDAYVAALRRIGGRILMCERILASEDPMLTPERHPYAHLGFRLVRTRVKTPGHKWIGYFVSSVEGEPAP